jgi:DNA-binding NtrC family response regulator
MEVLIVERDEWMRSMLVDALKYEGIMAVAVPDCEALNPPPEEVPAVVITSMNRGHQEDMEGLALVSVLRRRWPDLGAIYLAALWPARLCRQALQTRERFLPKPVSLLRMASTVREMLHSGGRRARAS